MKIKMNLFWGIFLIFISLFIWVACNYFCVVYNNPWKNLSSMVVDCDFVGGKAVDDRFSASAIYVANFGLVIYNNLASPISMGVLIWRVYVAVRCLSIVLVISIWCFPMVGVFRGFNVEKSLYVCWGLTSNKGLLRFSVKWVKGVDRSWIACIKKDDEEDIRADFVLNPGQIRIELRAIVVWLVKGSLDLSIENSHVIDGCRKFVVLPSKVSESVLKDWISRNHRGVLSSVKVWLWAANSKFHQCLWCTSLRNGSPRRIPACKFILLVFLNFVLRSCNVSVSCCWSVHEAYLHVKCIWETENCLYGKFKETALITLEDESPRLNQSCCWIFFNVIPFEFGKRVFCMEVEQKEKDRKQQPTKEERSRLRTDGEDVTEGVEGEDQAQQDETMEAGESQKMKIKTLEDSTSKDIPFVPFTPPFYVSCFYLCYSLNDAFDIVSRMYYIYM